MMAPTTTLSEVEEQESQATLVRVLTLKLEQLRAEKDQLERVLEEPLSQALAQLALQRQHQSSSNHKSHHRLKSDSTSPSTSSSSSASSSFTPPPFLNATQQQQQQYQQHQLISVASSASTSLPPVTASSFASTSALSIEERLRAENDELRQRLASSQAAHERAQQVNAKYERELKRLGFNAMGDLEDLQTKGQQTSRRERSNSRERTCSGASSTASSMGNYAAGMGVHIPGSSVSPPARLHGAARGTTAAASYLAATASSRASFSSINTTLTTPSTSFPITLPPPTSPASSIGTNGFGSFRASNGFFPAHPNSRTTNGFQSPPSRQQQLWPTSSSASVPPSSAPAPYDHSSARITIEDLLPFSASSTSSNQAHVDPGTESDDEGGRTPLSTSPGSRSGSLSRRHSVSLGVP